MAIYLDSFARKYVTKIDSYAVPERYYEILCNLEDDYCIEKWFLKNNEIINIKYPVELLLEGLIEEIQNCRKKAEIQCNSKLSCMISFTIPEEQYKEIEETVYE